MNDLVRRLTDDRRGWTYQHQMFVHWRGSPLCRAMFPPPSITPGTASMPRSALRTAPVLRELRRAALDVEAVVPAASRVAASGGCDGRSLLTSNPSRPLP